MLEATLQLLSVGDCRKVTPQKWKNAVLRWKYAHDKEGAIAFCEATWPGINLTPPRCRKKHDGIADALCIAYYGSLQ